MFLLSLPSLIDDDIGIAKFAIHQVVVADEARAIFKYQHLSAELIRRSRFATSVELRMGLEQAEQLFVVRDFLLQDDTPVGGITNLFGQFDPMLQLLSEPVTVRAMSVSACFCRVFARSSIVAARSRSRP